MTTPRPAPPIGINRPKLTNLDDVYARYLGRCCRLERRNRPLRVTTATYREICQATGYPQHRLTGMTRLFGARIEVHPDLAIADADLDAARAYIERPA